MFTSQKLFQNNNKIIYIYYWIFQIKREKLNQQFSLLT